MEETDKVKCPVCGTVQSEDIYDLTDPEDLAGVFPLDCESCDYRFKVEFEVKYYVKTS